MIRPGPLNLITDVSGILVGNAEDRPGLSGVTVVLPERRMLAAVDVRGGAPGTRETDALQPGTLVEAVDAIVLSGGSAFGLEAAGGVVTWLAHHGRGFQIADATVPIVPAAILFDLANGGDKPWAQAGSHLASPYRALGEEAVAAASAKVALGNAGAGLGATAGPYEGGLGSVSAVDDATGLTVGALFAVNALGTPVIPGQHGLWAWMLEQADELGGQPLPAGRPPSEIEVTLPELPGTNTTIGVVATDADLTVAEAWRLAVMAQDGLARALKPSHMPFDGDTVFALATAAKPLPEPRPRALARLGAMAADVTARAIARGVYLADPLGDRPTYRSRHGHALRVRG